ncbi:MAG: trimethylamine methyltransferase family protein [Anaerolineae bacterium]
MRVNYCANQSTGFRLLADDQLQVLYESALHILEHVGMEVRHEEATDLLRRNGAYVDGARVHIPSHMVRQALATAPRSFTVFSREGDRRKDLRIGSGIVNYGPGPTCMNFLDLETGERRQFTRVDAVSVARVCDALPNIDFVESLGTVSDVGRGLADTYEFAEMFANTGKPIVAWSYGLAGAEEIHDIAVAEAGGQTRFELRPNYIHYCEPLSPLLAAPDSLDKAIFAARHRVPLIYTPCVISGGTGPSTMAGVIVQAACESWLGLVLSQLVRPGTPFVMGGVVSIMDMSSMVLAYGAPELSLLSAGLTELAHHVGLPVWSTGGCSDSKAVDGQAALEGAFSVFAAALCGADLVHDVGYIEGGMTGSLQQLALMDETIGMVRHIARGIVVDEETLAVDTIADVGPSANYLGHEHTLRHFRSEFWFPRLIDRTRLHDWQAGGRRTMAQRARSLLLEVLETHQPTPLSGPGSAAIQAALAKAESRAPATA